MPPVNGLYAFVAGTVMFARLGSNPHRAMHPSYAGLEADGALRIL